MAGRGRSLAAAQGSIPPAGGRAVTHGWFVGWLVGWFGWVWLVGFGLGLVGLGLVGFGWVWSVGFGWVWSVGFGWLDLVRFHWLGWVGLNEFGWVGLGRVGSGRVGSGRPVGWLVCVCVCQLQKHSFYGAVPAEAGVDWVPPVSAG